MKAFVLLSCQSDLHPATILKAQQVNALWTLHLMERSVSLIVQFPSLPTPEDAKFYPPVTVCKTLDLYAISRIDFRQAPFLQPPAFLPLRQPITPRP